MLPIIVLVLAVVVLLWSFTVAAGFVLSWVLPWTLLGLVSGWAASRVMRSRHSLLENILVGIAGSIVGGALFGLLFHVRTGGILSLTHLAVSIIGAALLLAALRAVDGRSLGSSRRRALRNW